jgi:hypothetical protein
MATIPFDERLVVVGDAKVAGIEQDRMLRQLRGPRERRGAGRDLDRRGVALELDPPGGDADREQALPLILPQHLEAVDPPSQRQRPAQEEPERRRCALPELGDQTLGVEVGDAVGEPLAEQEIEGDEELDHERGAAGEQDLVRGAKLPPQAPDQPETGARRPQRPSAEVRAVVGLRPAADDPQASTPRPLLLRRVGRRGEAGEDHIFSLPGALAGAEESVLAYRAEIGRQPVAEVDQLVHQLVRYGRGHERASRRAIESPLARPTE